MAPTSPSRPTPAELARLEQAFASDSAEDAYHPLGEAYLALGRHLEAMVVCRKGVRSQPFSAKPHLLMARIHAAQGRKQKVVEALESALDREGKAPAVLLAAAELYLAIEDRERAADLLRRALEAGAAEAEVRALAQARGLAWDGPPAPLDEEAGTEAPAAARAAPGDPAGEASRLGNEVKVDGRREKAITPAPSPDGRARGDRTAGASPVENQRPGSQAPAPAPARGDRGSAPAPKTAGGKAAAAPARAPLASAPRALDPSAWEEEWDEAPPRGRKGLLRLGISAALMLGALLSWSTYSQWKGGRDKEIATLLERTIELQHKDTFAALREAYESAERAEKLGAGEARTQLAYLAALRWADHGEAAMLAQARAHLAQAPQRDGGGGRRLAAEALIAAGEGNVARALALLEEALQRPGGEGRGLLRTTLGRILAAQGRLEEAAAAYRQAVEEGARSPRLLASLGEALHRLGRAEEARRAYDQALALDSEHLPSRVGRATLLLDADPPPEAEREAHLARVETGLRPVLQAPASAFSSRELARVRQAAALLAYAKGEVEEGAKLEKEARALDPENPALRDLQERRQARLTKKP